MSVLKHLKETTTTLFNSSKVWVNQFVFSSAIQTFSKQYSFLSNKDSILVKGSTLVPFKIDNSKPGKESCRRVGLRKSLNSLVESNQTESLVTCSCKSLRVQSENLDEIKTSLRNEIMSDLFIILAENQREMLKLIAPSFKKSSYLQNLGDSDSETDNISAAPTSTPIKIERLFPIPLR